MPRHDAVHFDSYPPQTRAKHQILGAYLPAYLNALKNTVDRFHYIDGFAGRGTYEGRHPGSPLLALDEIGRAGLAARTSVSLVEERQDFRDEFARCIGAHPVTRALFDPPLIERGTFAEHLPEILGRPVYGRRTRVATFAFVDPCGVDGVEMTGTLAVFDKGNRSRAPGAPSAFLLPARGSDAQRSGRAGCRRSHNS